MLNTCTLLSGADQVLWVLKDIQILRPSLKNNSNNEYKSKYGNEYLFIVKNITTNYVFKKVDKHHKDNKNKKNNTIFLLSTWHTCVIQTDCGLNILLLQIKKKTKTI
jgi:hypothetical protein